jgi:dihydrofolate reductase
VVDVAYSVAVSLDGFVARPDLDFDWLGPFMASGDDYVGEFVDSRGALLVGSHTYAESEQTLEWFGQGPCSGKPVYVFTSRELPISGPNVALTDASPQQFVAELDERGITQAGLLSGPSLLSSFRAAGLVTGYFLGIIPVVLGGGLPLFDSPRPPEKLRLTDSKVWPNGVVQVRYEVIGG